MTVKERIQAQVDKTKRVDEISSIDDHPMLADPDMKVKLELKRKLDAVKKYTEAKLKELGQEIEIALIAEGVDGVMWDGCVVKQGRGRAGDKIVATKLVEQGVSLDVIAAATEEGKPYTFAQIVVPKDRQHPLTSWAEVEAILLTAEGWEG